MEAAHRLMRQSSLVKSDANRRGSTSGLRKLQDFFKVFLKRLGKIKISSDWVIHSFNSTSQLTIEEFIEKIKSFDNLQDSENLHEIFKLLTKEATLDSKKFIKELKRNLDSSSSESSDISSPSEGEYEEQQINPKTLEDLFEFLSFKLLHSEISKEQLQYSLLAYFSKPADCNSLSKFFLDNRWRIEDGPNRNMLVSFILNGRKNVQAEELSLVLQEKCLKSVEKENFQGNFEEFLLECRKIDFRKNGYLNWEQIQKALERVGKVGRTGFKYHCFCLEQSLDHIPYELI